MPHHTPPYMREIVEVELSPVLGSVCKERVRLIFDCGHAWSYERWGGDPPRIGSVRECPHCLAEHERKRARMEKRSRWKR